ncbi:MAG: PilZ domain-containing protein [Nitrospirae bacterium]|nr:PilZ domain-containing protein [Nitrospirota bacterium]
MKKVIVAKDIKAILEREKSFLDRSGVRIVTAATNEKALALHKAMRADLIIAKLATPDINGEVLCNRIREEEQLRNVSVILICSGTEVDLERCVRCRANAFISRPIDRDLLLQEAYRLLRVAPRMSCRIPVSIRIYGKAKTLPFTGRTENISASGMMFRTSALLFEGDSITCSFTPPGGGKIAARAEIMRAVGKKNARDDNHYGVRFTGLSAKAAAAVKSLVAQGGEHA